MQDTRQSLVRLSPCALLTKMVPPHTEKRMYASASHGKSRAELLASHLKQARTRKCSLAPRFVSPNYDLNTYFDVSFLFQALTSNQSSKPPSIFFLFRKLYKFEALGSHNPKIF